jgi:hypothetical protein
LSSITIACAAIRHTVGPSVCATSAHAVEVDVSSVEPLANIDGGGAVRHVWNNPLP